MTETDDTKAPECDECPGTLDAHEGACPRDIRGCCGRIGWCDCDGYYDRLRGK